MAETEQLLANRKYLRSNHGIDDTPKKSTNNFTDYRRWFRNKDSDNNYQKLEDGTENNNPNKLVGFSDLLYFADRADLLMLFITACLLLLQTLCLVAGYVITGRLMGLFAMKSFTDSCYYHYQNSSIFDSYNYNYSRDLALNSSIYDQSHKLYNGQDIVLSSIATTSTVVFRTRVMSLVHFLFITGAIEFITSTIYSFTWSLTVRRQASRLRVRLFKSLIQRNIFYLDTNPTNQLNSKLFDNIEKIENGLDYNNSLFVVLTILQNMIIIIVALVITWKLTLIMLCLIPFVIMSSSIFSKMIVNLTKKELNMYARAGHIVQEVFSSIRTVLSLNGGKFEQQRYERELHSTRWSTICQGAVFGLFMGFLSFINFTVYAVGFIFGSILMTSENDTKLNISDLIVIVVLFARCMSKINFAGPGIQALLEAWGAVVPIFRLIKEEEETYINESEVWNDSTSDIQLFDGNGDIKFENVDFSYPSREHLSILNNINFIARAGETTAIVGSSGCGKSTCLSLLLRFYEPSSGRITINEKPITNYSLKHLRQNIGVVSQEPVLFDMSIYENIRFGKLNATRNEIEEAAKQANAHNFIMQLPNKYETYVGEHGVKLSGGEKQRVALARALVKQSAILLLDEATSSLDNVNEKLVQEALDRASQGRTTIVIAHRLSTIENVDQIYVFDKGNVIEQGTHTTLMGKEGGIYQKMVKSQQIEGLGDHKDGMTSTNKMEEEDQREIYERTRLRSVSQTVEEHKESSLSAKRPPIFLRLLSMNSPEWITVLIGCLACLINGVGYPMFAILLAKIIEAFNDCFHSKQHQVLISSCWFLVLGFSIWIFRFIQYTAFAISGSTLIQRIRSKTFACLLRQEIAYFDHPENSSGAITARLSSEASAIQKIISLQLGAICESFSLTLVSLSLGLLFSCQLTIIIFIALVLFIFFSYLHVRFTMGHCQKTGFILEQASSLAVQVIHNMRTVKQLSVEKEVLQQYSQSIDQVYKISRKFFLAAALTQGMYFILPAYVSAFLYWRALILIEQHKINSGDIIMVFAFTFFILEALKIFKTLSTHISASVSAATRFFDLCDRTPTIDNSSTKGRELPDFRGKIEFNQVKFAYPARPTSFVLNDFQLSIKPGN